MADGQCWLAAKESSADEQAEIKHARPNTEARSQKGLASGTASTRGGVGWWQASQSDAVPFLLLRVDKEGAEPSFLLCVLVITQYSVVVNEPIMQPPRLLRSPLICCF